MQLQKSVSEVLANPVFVEFHWRVLGVQVGRYHQPYDSYGNYDRFSFWWISYASALVPLTVLSSLVRFPSNAVSLM